MSVDDGGDDGDDVGDPIDIYRVDPEGIADEVKSGQGFLWQEHPDRGKVPYYVNRPTKWAASDDPGTWAAAEEAIEAALERDDYGFGFPCPQEHELMFVDVDTPWGGEWVPTFDRLGGAVIEHSPSENYRVILRDVKVPEWWTNLSIKGKGKPEIKLFDDTGYVSLTGDVIDGHGLPLEETTQIAFEKFLKEAWGGFHQVVKEEDVTEEDGPWNADDEDSTETTTLDSHSDDEGGSGKHDDDAEEWMKEQDVRDALRHIDPTLGHDDWVTVGFGLGDFFARDDVDGDEETALTVYREWSRGDLVDDHSGAKWDNAAQEDAPNIISRAYHDEKEGDNPATIATIVSMAEDGGWDMSACPSAELGRIKRFRGETGDDTDSTGGDGMALDYDVDTPVYEVLEPKDGDVELRIVPINGTSAGIEVAQNGIVVYHEVRDRGFWNSQTIRGRIASEVANSITGVDKTELKQGIKDALTAVGVEEREQPETFENKMRSDREEALRERTERVMCHPTADVTEWVITMTPPDDSPVTEAREITLTQGDFNDPNAGSFRNAHLGTFFSKVELDHQEWDGLTDYWLETQVTDDYEPDHRVEALVEKFTDWSSNLRVWADQEGFSWSSLHGYYVENYDGADDDAVLVPGQQVMDWLAGEHADDDLNFSRELKERGVMLDTPSRHTINGRQRRAWPISAEATGHSPETAHHTDTDGSEDDDRPEGLR